MPFSIGWSELIVVGIVALIIMGPQDLAVAFRKLGRFTGRLRGMAREFQYALNDAADKAGVNEIKSQIKEATDLKGAGLDDLGDAFDMSTLGEPASKSTNYGRVETGKPEAKTNKGAAKASGAKTAKAAKTTGAKKPATKKSAAKTKTTKAKS